MSYVSLARPGGNNRRIVVASVLAGFVIILGIAATADILVKRGDAMAAAAPIMQAAPYDIKLTEKIPEQIPVADIAPRPMPYNVSPMEIEVTAGDTQKTAPTVPDDAVQAATEAERSAQQGDPRQALRLQHRAAELAPSNMLYRLDLAILYDRVGDKKDAATLYRQVMQAYDANDASLPRTLDIHGIRVRADYLASSPVRPSN